MKARMNAVACNLFDLQALKQEQGVERTHWKTFAVSSYEAGDMRRRCSSNVGIITALYLEGILL